MSTQRVKTQSFCWVCMCLRVSVCVCVKSVAINCVCLLCHWRDSPLLLWFRGVFATCGPPTHSQLTSHSTSYTLSALHLQPSTCNLLTWRRLLDVDASFVLAYDFTFRRFPMQLHIRPRSTALHDERFVCVAHHAMLRRTQCQAVMVIGQDASCNDRKREREREGWVCGLGGQSLWLMAR